MASTPIIITIAECQHHVGLDLESNGLYLYEEQILEGVWEAKGHSLIETNQYQHHSISVNHINSSESTEQFTPQSIKTVRKASLSQSRARPLTKSPPSYHNEMTSFTMQAPGSPPELSGSKSSKSSSFHSSSLSGNDGLCDDLSHFEDIGLDDDSQQLNQDLFSIDLCKRQSPSITPVHMIEARSSTVGTRELTIGAKRPTFPPPHSQARHATSHDSRLSLNLPNSITVKKRLTSPSTSSLAMTAMRNRSRSRSPSSNQFQTGIGLLPNMGNETPQLRSAALPSLRRPSVQRGSWQPNRKTAQELEEEYHDSDEDLPDDASLWNVPLSPHGYRSSMSATPSANVSANTSPERPSRRSEPLGMVPLRTSHTAPAGSQYMHGIAGSMPSSPLKPEVARGASTGVMADHFGFSKSRTKSWTAALSDLSEEAKSLTDALEEHAIQIDRQHEEKIHNGVSSMRPSLEKLARSKTTVVELPPLRKSNVMIDPLPISKEKERVLSRTRPSWLPPKSRKEEKRHLKQYQKIMLLSVEAEKKRAAKVVSQQCARDDTKTTLLRIWEEHVLPNWDQAIREPRTRELFWRGITPRSRAQVWQRAIGNELALTDATYAKALQRAKDVEKDIASNKNEEVQKEKAWFDAIQRDVDATFSDLKMFQPEGPLHASLVDLLKAYTMYRSDVGYSHGIHLAAALLLLVLPSVTCAFTSLANLLNRPLPLALLTGDEAGIERAYTLTLNLLALKFPKLYARLFNSAAEDGLELSAENVLDPMMRTFFLQGSTTTNSSAVSSSSTSTPSSPIGPSPRGLTLESASRVWDVMVFDGDAMMIRTCVGLLGILESKFYGSREEVQEVLGWGARGGWGLGQSLGEEDFVKAVRNAGKQGRK